MGCRLLLIVILAKYLSPSDLGQFGLMIATVSFGVQLIGGEYYAYSQRELVAMPKTTWSTVIKGHIKAQLILYSIFLPVHTLIFIYGLMAWEYIFWLFALLIVEHLSQEITRLLIVLQKQFIASTIIFLRSGIWVFALFILFNYQEEYRNLTAVYSAWILGCLLSVGVGLLVLLNVIPKGEGLSSDFKWIMKGFKIAVIFLIASISFKSLLTFDKYLLEIIGSSQELGAYIFYMAIVIGVFNFLDPAVFSFLYPRLLKSYQLGQFRKFKRILNELLYSTVTLSIVLSVLIWLVVPELTALVSDSTYFQHVDSLILLISVGFVATIGYIPHYALYAAGEEIWIIISNVVAVLVFCLSVNSLQCEKSITVIGLSLLLAFSSMLILKVLAYKATIKNKVLLGDI